MKYSVFMLLIFVCGCGNPKVVENEIIKEEIRGKLDFEPDTILERNNPQQLNLSNHQLFIDTTRNSKFYESLVNWKPDKYDINTAIVYIEELNKISKSKKVNFNNFPRMFVRINKLENEFYLYDRCDGIDPRYELRDSAFIFYGTLESDAETIKKVHSIDGNGVKLELNSFKEKTLNGFSKLEILKTEYEGIYLMKYQNENIKLEEFVIPATDILKYDLVVNHCPKTKRREYSPFY